MAKVKFDGVVETVRYQPDGQVAWVRAYLRRGAIFSDRVMLNRQELIEQLNSGKRFMAGRRIALMAGTFEVTRPVHVVSKNGQEVLATGDLQADKDYLEGVPVI